METKLKVDQAGRVMIPKALRTELHLGAGDELALVSVGDEIRLRPIRAKARLKKKLGVWVYQGESVAEDSIQAIVDSERAKRHRSVMGSEL
jgi:AbrB family looped-hinge helix DNA binding protein